MLSFRRQLTATLGVWAMVVAPSMTGCTGDTGSQDGAVVASDTLIDTLPADAGAVGSHTRADDTPSEEPEPIRVPIESPALEGLPDYVLISADSSDELGFVAGKADRYQGNETLGALVGRNAAGTPVRVVGAQYQLETQDGGYTIVGNMVGLLGPDGRPKQIVIAEKRSSANSPPIETTRVIDFLEYTEGSMSVRVVQYGGALIGDKQRTLATDAVRSELEALAAYFDQGILEDGVAFRDASVQPQAAPEALSGEPIGWSTGLRVAGLILNVGGYVASLYAPCTTSARLHSGLEGVAGTVGLCDATDALMTDLGADPLGPPTTQAMQQLGAASPGLVVMELAQGVQECLVGDCTPLVEPLAALRLRLAADRLDVLKRREALRLAQDWTVSAGPDMVIRHECAAYFGALFHATITGGVTQLPGEGLGAHCTWRVLEVPIGACSLADTITANGNFPLRDSEGNFAIDAVVGLYPGWLTTMGGVYVVELSVAWGDETKQDTAILEISEQDVSDESEFELSQHCSD